jgi:hypothetical protein
VILAVELLSFFLSFLLAKGKEEWKGSICWPCCNGNGDSLRCYFVRVSYQRGQGHVEDNFNIVTLGISISHEEECNGKPATYILVDSFITGGLTIVGNGFFAFWFSSIVRNAEFCYPSFATDHGCLSSRSGVPFFRISWSFSSSASHGLVQQMLKVTNATAPTHLLSHHHRFLTLQHHGSWTARVAAKHTSGCPTTWQACRVSSAFSDSRESPSPSWATD